MKKQEEQIAELMKDKEFVKLVKLIENTHPFYVETIALRVYEKYQPKLSEDSVVVTETERITMSVKQWDKGYAQGSKITAEKIYRDYLCDILSPEAKEEFAKQFSVSIKK